MTATAKNADAITPFERRHPLLARFALWMRRPFPLPEAIRRLAVWPWLFGAFCLWVAVLNHVRWTEKLGEFREQCGVVIELKDREITLYKPAPQPMRCRDYTTSPYDQAVERTCHRTITKL